jgi:quinol-cytochrome oxidoreductase complex cytochrome b subunit
VKQQPVSPADSPPPTPSSQVWRSIFRHGYPRTDSARKILARTNFFLHLHPTKITRKRITFCYTWCLGGTSFLLFCILIVTGVLLMFYYRPTVVHAYQDMKDLEFSVTFGRFLRNLHRWSAHGMVLTVIGHMARVFFTGSYKPPREFNWVVGVCLFMLTLFLSFTGYLLPWDQLAYWAVTVGTSMAKAAPLVGADGPFRLVDTSNDLSLYLLGGRTVGAGALLRFYVLHVIALPVIMLVLIAIHFWRIRKDGTIKRPL